MTVTHRKRKERDAAGGGMKYHCDNCRRDITNTIRVRCAECTDFDLCVECFSRGVEVGKHLNNHPYRLLDKYAFPLLDIEWGADEEWLLIEGICTYGLGNWQDVADHVGTKSLEECQSHYIKYYINSPKYPLPDFDVKLDTEEVKQMRIKRQSSPIKSQSVLPPLKPKVMQSVPSNHELQGYMPGRMEFEHEHENEAEVAVKDLVFLPDDTPTEVDLKATILDIYNSRLDRRMERKKFIFDRNLIDFKRIQQADRKRSREEKEVINQTKVFSRLMTDTDYNSFVEGLVLENSIKERIRQLQEYRRNGIRTFKESELYEQDKKARLTHLAKIIPSTDRLAQKQRPSLSLSTMPTGTPSFSPALNSSMDQRQRGNNPTPLDLQGCDGVDQLTAAEQALCSSLRLFPRAYMTIKNVIIREAEKRGGLKRREARALVRIDVNKLGKIYDFFVTKSWIKVPK